VLAAVVFLAVPESASAGSSTDAALALGAFAVFNQIVTGQTIFHQRPAVIYQQPPTVIYQAPPPVVYAPPPVVYAPPPPVVYAPPPPPVVVYPPAPAYYYGYAEPSYSYVAPGYYRVHRRHRHHDDD
jgi:hypothetical protein